VSAALACDVLVVGSGAGGLMAALTAVEAGLDVILIEKADKYGGTTAHSEGMIWVPSNHHAEAADKADDPAAALAYLEGVAGNHLDQTKSAIYVRASSEMLRFLETNSRVRYALAGSLDYYPAAPGATRGTRSLRVLPIDGRSLGSIFEQIRPPLKSTLAFGGMTIIGTDLPDALQAHRSLWAFLRMAKLALRYGFDRMKGYSRGTRIGNGHAVVACLVEALSRRGARMVRQSALLGLVVEAGKVAGARIRTANGEQVIKVGEAVILATGGFSGNRQRQQTVYPERGRSTPSALLAAETSMGEGIAAAEAVGGEFFADLAQPAAWTPASLVPQPDGSNVAFPHYIDRNKPGFIAVDKQGQRFANEAAVYHDFVAAMIEHGRGATSSEAWLIADSRAVDRYGIGACPPFPALVRKAVKSGYLFRANSIADLAQAITVPAEVLAATIARFNSMAGTGKDDDFHRGETAYERACGDPSVTPNPSLGPLDAAPYYAVRLVPSDIGTFAGLRTDSTARVLNRKGQPIGGLYAVGNDAASAFGGTYPAAGITVGLALTFGYVAAKDIAARKVKREQHPPISAPAA
jgi:succinate dehydrogenase/fumarate reductase flavoprotein subunit